MPAETKIEPETRSTVKVTHQTLNEFFGDRHSYACNNKEKTSHYCVLIEKIKDRCNLGYTNSTCQPFNLLYAQFFFFLLNKILWHYRLFVKYYFYYNLIHCMCLYVCLATQLHICRGERTWHLWVFRAILSVFTHGMPFFRSQPRFILNRFIY